MKEEVIVNRNNILKIIREIQQKAEEISRDEIKISIIKYTKELLGTLGRIPLPDAEITVYLKEALQNKKEIKGEFQGEDDQSITVKENNNIFRVPWHNIIAIEWKL